MDKSHYALVLILSLGIISFSLCIVSEVKKTKRNDLKLDNKLCYLPGSPAVGLGISALIFLVAAQVIGNFIIRRNFCYRRKRTGNESKNPFLTAIFLVLSWISFGIALVLLSAATSMNREQPYGKGWLDGECYLVRDGVFLGSAILVLVAVGSMIFLAVIMKKRKSQFVLSPKVHAQLGSTKTELSRIGMFS